MADRGLEIWQKLFQIKCVHIVNTKFDFFQGQILHAYLAIYKNNLNNLQK